jgi:DNA-directed RNA polymerase specialized sigma24 family protein
MCLDGLYNLATWLAGDAADAQALVRATLRQALQRRPRDPAGATLPVRLFATMWDVYRRQHGVTAHAAGAEATEAIAMERRSLLRTLSKADLDAGLRQLPAALRATLILTDMEGCPLEEVALILGCSKLEAHAALVRARHLLHHVLQARLAATVAWPAPEAEG